MKTKDRKKRDAEILGMPAGTAQVRLLKSLVLHLAQQVGSEAQCRHCGGWINDPDDLAIEHLNSWRQLGAAAYWDLNNIALRHKGCSSQPATPRHSTMKHVEITIEDLNGQHLRSFLSDNSKFHVAGTHGIPYQIRIKNITGKKIEVVTTVDGRDVCSGEVGDTKASGYMLHAYADIVIKGYRKSMTETTQFRFSPKSESYSSKMGTAQNVGVIGVAVFTEKEKDYPKIFRSLGLNSEVNTSGGRYTMGGGGLGTSYTSSTSDMTLSESSSAPLSKGIRSRRSTRQDIGTEFSGSVQDRVHNVTFERASETPAQTEVIYYDTLSAITEKGYMTEVGQVTRQPMVVQGEGPHPFPNSQRFAQPPPGYRE